MEEQLRVNHRGNDGWLYALAEFVDGMKRWAAKKKKFRVTLDYDPEWTLLIRFRLMDEKESAEMDALNPLHGE